VLPFRCHSPCFSQTMPEGSSPPAAISLEGWHTPRAKTPRADTKAHSKARNLMAELYQRTSSALRPIIFDLLNLLCCIVNLEFRFSLPYDPPIALSSSEQKRLLLSAKQKMGSLRSTVKCFLEFLCESLNVV
jgi:hypothetical protein